MGGIGRGWRDAWYTSLDEASGFPLAFSPRDAEGIAVIHVTSAAARELRSLLKHSRAVAGHAVRLIPNRRGGVAMLVGLPLEGDVVIEEAGVAVLIVAAELVGQLDGLVFDWTAREIEGEARRDFGLRRPNGDEALLSSAPADRGIS